MKKLLSLMLSLFLLFGTAAFTACSDKGGDLTIKYYSAGSDLLPMLISGKETVGLLPEPAASTLEKKTQGEKTWYRLDLQELYDGEEKAYPQAVLMVKSSVLEAYPDIVGAFSEKLSENVAWAKTYISDAVNAVKGLYESTTLSAQSMTAQVIDNCKIYWQSAADAKTQVNKYLEDIRAIDSAAANAMDDSFYYAPSAAESGERAESLAVYAPDGAPALAIAKFIFDGYDFGTGAEINYNVVQASAIATAMSTGAGDIIVMPVNAATKLYAAGNNQNDPYKMAAVITHGNFYIMSTEKITVQDLKGKRIGVPNRGQVPDWTFQSVLKKNGITFALAD